MKLTHVQLIRVSEEDHQAIAMAAARLGLTQAEVTRRSIRIALPILNDLNVPGAQPNYRMLSRQAKERAGM